MLPLSILERTDNSILYEILAGKPNPNQKCTDDVDTRDRIEQSFNFHLFRTKIVSNCRG